MSFAPQKLVSAAVKALPAGTPSNIKNFAQALFDKIPADDLAHMSPENMARTAEHHWTLTAQQQKDAPEILLYNITEEHSEKRKSFDAAPVNRTHIDIVCPDMAFLVDSIAAEITANHSYLIHLLLHTLLEQPAKEKKSSDDAPVYLNHIHIELQSALSPSVMKSLAADLKRVIHDVRFATRDWRPMKEKLRVAQKGLIHAPKTYPDAEIEEYLHFLEYLHKDNFTLLGYREYQLKERKGKIVSEIVKGSSLGLLHDEMKPVYINGHEGGLPQDLQRMRHNLPPLNISKVNKKSTVHRRVPLDAIAVKQYDKKGNITGELLFIGLFTSVTYSRSIQDVPYLRYKAEIVTHRSGFLPGSHDYKALRHTLEKYPRDELFQIGMDDLLDTALNILRLQERQRTALFTRHDPFERYISCLVYVPRDRYDTRLRLAIQHILEEEFGGTCDNFHTNLDDSPLARVMYTIYFSASHKKKKYDETAIEIRLQEAGKLWREKLCETLLQTASDDEVAPAIVEKYGEAFPINYREQFPLTQAVYDIEKMESVLESGVIALNLYKCDLCAGDQIRLKIYNKNEPIILSSILPILENMGLHVISELPFEIQPQGSNDTLYLHDFMLEGEEAATTNIKNSKNKFEEALSRIWYGEMDNDGLNRLILTAQMDWREITILRSCVRYIRQARYPFSTRYIEKALTKNAAIARHLVDLFKALHDPAQADNAQTKAAGALVAIEHELENVTSLDEDRILQSLTAVIKAILRTNFYQSDENGQPKSYLSFKLDSKKIQDLPQPRPYREIYVYSPRMEGIHLRGDAIARGGLRWSDRHEDFRTEILGLMKAQQVKNSVIVPMGAKGGFIVKRPPTEGGRQAFMEEGIACYKTLIRGLLDLTDNRKGTKVIPPKDVVRYDDDDPYLVVAADKGTASFSDIANGISAEYGFWLGDAFASGGSAGYDHKKMGITARGAWESVKRHFREFNHDIQKQDFAVVGIGDMGGDVFGNGMLLSEHIRLIGAFNHLHIFCDPDPDTAKSYKERQRLFNDVTGWDGYNTKLLSKGGRIYSRADKSLELTREIKERFDIDQDRVSPAELIQAMLRARTDLLWFGGIGTYIKATKETHADAGDKANDNLRINANEIRARVIGEGANLAITQRARIEYAMQGGRLNADFIDNSAGVDSSDHEVNIKILLAEIMGQKDSSLSLKKRNNLLEKMTEEVAGLVLRHNYQQTQGISLTEKRAAEDLPLHAEFIKDLERSENLDRALEGLPDEEEIEQRLRTGKGLTRPEIAVLFSYAKISFTRALLDSDIPDIPDAELWLFNYFPSPLRKKYEKEIKTHRLRREIIATTMASIMVDRLGPTFIKDRMEKTGASAADIARAFIIVREAFSLRPLWDAVESLDNKVPALLQINALQDIAEMVERDVTWFLTRLGRSLDITKDTKEFKSGIDLLHANLDDVMTDSQMRFIDQRTDMFINDGLPRDLAYQIARIPRMAAACDIIRIALETKMAIPLTAKTYFAAGEYFPLHWLRKQARYMTPENRWAAEALDGMIEQLYSCQSGLTIRILNDTAGDIKNKACDTEGIDIIKCWVDSHCQAAHLLDEMFAEMKRHGTIDLPMLMIAEQRIRNLYGG